MLEIVRPPKIEVKIYGKIHELRRISEGDLIDLLRILKGKIPDLEGLVKRDPEAMLGLFQQGGDVMDFILRRSFPTHEEWEGMTVSAKLELFNVAFTESRVLDILKDFTNLIRKAGTVIREIK
ncbi:MAG: hypothetical protein LLG93_05675 [Deltaproteobacteria bacterium]|nr:hypothetical protein [Deltaproteobacteria bacterium]